MFIDIILFVVFGFLLIPTMTAYYAYTHGRSFWLWFLLGTFLPIIANVILLLLPDAANPVEQELEELRIKNKMLGVSTEQLLLFDLALKNALAQPRKKLSFEVRESFTGNYQVVEPCIDGINLKILLRQQLAKQKTAAQATEGLPLATLLSPVSYYLGEVHPLYSRQNRQTLLMNANQNLTVEICEFREVIIWREFIWHQADSQQQIKLGIWVFDRLPYVQTLRQLAVEAER